MKKRSLITFLGAIGIISTSLTAVVSCSSNTTYKVLIDNTKDKNYVIAIPDINYQPIPYLSNGFIYWDISSDFKGAKYNKALNDFFKQNSSKVIFATKNDKPYQNGFEWFIYELLKAKDHNIDLELPFNNKKDIGLDSNFISDKAVGKLTDILTQKGKDLLKIEKEINPSSTKTGVDMIDAALVKYNAYATSKSGSSLGSTFNDLKANFPKGTTTFKVIKEFADLYNKSIDSEISKNPNDKILQASKIIWDYKVPIFSIPKEEMKKSANDRAIYLKTKALEFINAFWNVELIEYNETNNKFASKPLSKVIFDKAVDDMLKKV